MHNQFTIAIFAGIGGMFGWGLADFFAKKTIDRLGPLKSLAWGHIFGSLLFAVIAIGSLIAHRHTHSYALGLHFSDTIGLALFGMLQMAVYWCAYLAFEKGQLAVLNPIFASYSGIVALFAALFFAETIRPLLGIALAVIFIGILGTNLDIKGLRDRQLKVVPGLKEIIAAAILAAVWTLGWDKFIQGKDPIASAAIMYIFMSITAIAVAKFSHIRLSGMNNSDWALVIAIGGCECLAYLAITWGYHATTYVSVVALVSGAFSLPTLVLAFLFLRERVSRVQLLSSCCIVAGILLAAVR